MKKAVVIGVFVVICSQILGCQWDDPIFTDGSGTSQSGESLVIGVPETTSQSAELNVNDSLKLQAVFYSEDSGVDITDSVLWEVSNPVVADINDEGTITALSEGMTSIFATYNNVKSHVFSLTIIKPYLTSITILATDESVFISDSPTFRASGTFSNGETDDVTSLVDWHSSNSTVVSISNTGIPSLNSVGTTTISASSNGFTSNSLPLTIVATVMTDLTLFPATASVAFEGSQAFNAIATYNDGGTSDVTNSVTWNSTVSDIAHFSSNTVTGVTTGSTQITASLNGITSSPSDFNVATFPLCGGIVNDVDLNNAAGACLKVAFFADRYLTGTPSEAAMIALGYTLDSTSSNTGKTYGELVSETLAGGTTAYFASFQQTGLGWDSDLESDTFGADGAYDRYCNYLADINFNYKNNWSRIVLGDMNKTRNRFGNMKANHGWAASEREYNTKVATHVSFSGFFTNSFIEDTGLGKSKPETPNYASCISPAS
ncbi:Ig-like domain-containing protein [Enterovibrio norvegicus]|uniref:Ig-like domain-containing protein n=1 Tax=Enterovibrio norvegicus TaxID=188144 RepID=UPI000CB9A2C5|nr:Ig-like domain-containing protein [Enterovibrio norvegicus]PML77820.1 hypothetical protein BCT69_18165 [Enterovibrio norvegicus]